jgi:methylmalonyl-CoA mutase, C-terminal domain
VSHPSTGSAVAPATDRKIRVLVAKVGLDGHDRGAKVIACLLRDAGMEVIYTGLHQSPEQVVEAALQEDVEALGLSILSGAHMTLFPKVRKLMKEKGLENVLLTGGGIIPPEDDAALRRLGVGKLFGPGTPGGDIVAYIREEIGRRRGGVKTPAKKGKAPSKAKSRGRK